MHLFLVFSQDPQAFRALQAFPAAQVQLAHKALEVPKELVFPVALEELVILAVQVALEPLDHPDRPDSQADQENPDVKVGFTLHLNSSFPWSMPAHRPSPLDWCQEF